ncbi:histidine kinase dimerization/phosphoacceptor domain -containing protein [Roseomonas sp. E05]|uniref:sensor histidine kinase n=1 Tax=Roseomonas sp. E05 TaxID=3046310 RepID=UPI0024B8A316|nr:histidine kinase dimerization/phosphoacceptor domain -containing protein [Roseomonas sp. E05]MDJ0387178.1 histidine kinase dimerization/phosphoacceptor domain -containing protein [Roseomonas sp. E05]
MSTVGGGLAVALACAGASLLARAALLDVCQPAVGLVLFYPAILLAGTVSGRPAGLAVVGVEALTQAWLLQATGSAPAEACGLLLALLSGTAVAFAAGELHQALNEVEALQKRLHCVQDLAGIGEWEWPADGSTLNLSDRAWALLGQQPRAQPVSAGQFYTMLDPDDVGALRTAASTALAGRSPELAMEFRVLSADGKPRWRLMRGLPQGESGGLAGVLIDITPQRRMEQACQQALARQELVYRELAHRVKNNFQLTASLLRLQSRRVDPGLRPVLEGAIHRMDGMAALHESLSQGGAEGQVAFDAYLHGICNHLARVYTADRGITLTVEADATLLPADRALLLGLAIVELVGNAVRHAFSADTPGRIVVGFRQVPEGFRLWVEDDGVGFEELEPMRAAGFGMLLVQSCAQQLEGELVIERAPATHFEIRLPPQAAG